MIYDLKVIGHFLNNYKFNLFYRIIVDIIKLKGRVYKIDILV